MIVALLLIALLQDGPVQTAPPTAEAPAPALSGQDAGESGQTAGAAEPSVREICDSPANRRVTESAFACAVRLERERRGPMRYDRFRSAAGRGDRTGVPGWALADPARWETSQCGADGDDACRRQARNRLAMARAGVAAEPPPAAGGVRVAAPQNCRMVMRRSESGFGGSLSRICGDDAEAGAEAALDRLQESLRPAAEPCDRPANLETQAAWIARCQGLPDR
ncbi:MAG: hypothetical protein Q8O54_03130 [Brevundimonas sp.]|nr:hypothetical protein [Brevundimonas sp.]